MPYGYITTSNEWKKQLKNFNRGYNGRKTWDELYGTIDTAAQKGSSIATQDYTDAISQAYGSAFGQKAAIANSNLFTGYKDAAIADIDYGLAEAYDTYRQNYLTQKAKVDENATLAREQISTALGTEAENFKAYQDSYYGYLTDLYNRAYGLNDYEDVGADETLKTMFTTHPLWNRYLVNNGQDGVDPTLISSSDLYAKLFDTKTGTINAQGTDFYKQMMYQLGPELGKYGFSEYLSKANPKLYEWSMTQNPYNYTEGGTNAATFRQSVGLDSKDATYNTIEAYKTMPSEVFETIAPRKAATDAINTVSKAVSNYDASHGNDTKKLLKNLDGVITQLEEYAKNVGVYDSVDFSKYTSDLDMLEEELQNVKRNQGGTYSQRKQFVDKYGETVATAYEEYVKDKVGSTSSVWGQTDEGIYVRDAVPSTLQDDFLVYYRKLKAKELEKLYNDILSDIDKAVGH